MSPTKTYQKTSNDGLQSSSCSNQSIKKSLGKEQLTSEVNESDPLGLGDRPKEFWQFVKVSS